MPSTAAAAKAAATTSAKVLTGCDNDSMDRGSYNYNNDDEDGDGDDDQSIFDWTAHPCGPQVSPICSRCA